MFSKNQQYHLFDSVRNKNNINGCYIFTNTTVYQDLNNERAFIKNKNVFTMQSILHDLNVDNFWFNILKNNDL